MPVQGVLAMVPGRGQERSEHDCAALERTAPAPCVIGARPAPQIAGYNPDEANAPMNRFVAGALAGLVATVPMTLAMVLWRERLLPPGERYDLPPREITLEAAERVGMADHLDDEAERHTASTAAHYGFGALAGAAGAPMILAETAAGNNPALQGVLWGLIVWGGTYLGLLPAAAILRPATEHPPRRTAMMIGVHVIWGAVTGLLTDRLADRPK